MTAEVHSPVPRHIVVQATKSVGIQILLVVFLGPLGLFYSTIKGALVMLFVVPLACALIALLSGIGIGNPTGALVAVGSEILLGVATWWIGSFAWGVVAVNSYNRKLLEGAGATM